MSSVRLNASRITEPGCCCPARFRYHATKFTGDSMLATITDPNIAMTRRDFLRTAGTLSGVLWSSSSALLALAPSPAWSLPLAILDSHAGEVLLKLSRHIYPHAKLDDAVYALVVNALDSAAADSALKTLLVDGVKALDAAAGGDWLTLPGDKQLAGVQGIAGKLFFEKVRSTAVVALYNNELAFAHFGYEGNAFKHGGGYLQRGFSDLNWLPAPTADASPPPA